MNKYIYLNKEEAIRGFALVHSVCYEPIENYKEVFMELHNLNVIEFYGNDIPHHITLENDTVREATKYELYERGIHSLTENEYIKDKEIKEIPPQQEGIIKGKFDYDKEEWFETATEDEITEHKKKLAEEEYRKQLPTTVFDMDNRLYMTQDMLDMIMFEMMSMQTFAMTTMTIEKQEEYMTTQAFYYYDRIIQKEKREGLQSATNYYNLVVSKFPQYKSDIDFLLIENDKEYIIG